MRANMEHLLIIQREPTVIPFLIAAMFVFTRSWSRKLRVTKGINLISWARHAFIVIRKLNWCRFCSVRIVKAKFIVKRK